jgi:hypothetical protein
MEQIVGYKLVKTGTQDVVSQFGGILGQCPGIPNPLVLPNDDQVCAASLDTDYNGYTLINWTMEEPIPSTDPADYPLTARQIRLGLIRTGVSLSLIQNAINALPSPARDEAQAYLEFSTVINWAHPMTQTLVALVGISDQQAETMWMIAKDYES